MRLWPWARHGCMMLHDAGQRIATRFALPCTVTRGGTASVLAAPHACVPGRLGPVCGTVRTDVILMQAWDAWWTVPCPFLAFAGALVHHGVRACAPCAASAAASTLAVGGRCSPLAYHGLSSTRALAVCPGGRPPAALCVMVWSLPFTEAAAAVTFGSA